LAGSGGRLKISGLSNFPLRLKAANNLHFTLSPIVEFVNISGSRLSELSN
jgi:hypothetical protein